MRNKKKYKEIKRHTVIICSSIWIAFFTASCTVQKNNNIIQQQEVIKMKNILIIGMNPHTLDFTNPELPK